MKMPESRRADFTEVPMIDISSLGMPGEEEDRTVAAIRDAAERVGFFYATGHGVPDSSVDGVFEQCRRFFSLAQDERDAILLTRSPNYRGYLPVGARGDNADRPKDLLESFNFGAELGDDHPLVRAGIPLHGENQWPDNLPGFRGFIIDYYDRMERLMMMLLQGFALAAGLERHEFDRMHRRPLTQGRLLCYQPQFEQVDGMLGARAHTDSGLFTILLQDEVGGLEVQNHAGEWVVAPPVPYTYIINVGDMLAHITNEQFHSAVHRVVNRYGQTRYSVPFFINPDFDAVLDVHPRFREEGEDVKYQPVHVGEHMRSFYRNLWPSAPAAAE